MSISRLNATIVELESRIAALKSAIDGKERDIEASKAEAAAHQDALKATKERMLALERRLNVAETQRRRLHNQVLELKGNIRVFCRVRPLLPDERIDGESADLPNYRVVSGGDLSEDTSIGNDHDDRDKVLVWQEGESVTGQARKQQHDFSFDKVFGPAASQADVFAEISDLVQASLDGFRVCIFAYGQTGSGKTFTMEGSDSDPGMIPLAVQQIFATSERLCTERKWSFTFECTYLEIYNESIRDLLSASGNAGDLEIKQGGKMVVPGATVVAVADQAALLSVLHTAHRNRSVGATNCNERSSRSHSVFSLYVTAVNKITNERLEGTLNLIDLAGSERLAQSQSTGERLKETQHINRSLSALGDVISALQSQQQQGGGAAGGHVPYRNSKLTHLLQGSLGGASSKTLMFVNVNPAPGSVGESLCSLRFATKVNSTHIGTAKRNVLKQA